LILSGDSEILNKKTLSKLIARQKLADCIISDTYAIQYRRWPPQQEWLIISGKHIARHRFANCMHKRHLRYTRSSLATATTMAHHM